MGDAKKKTYHEEWMQKKRVGKFHGILTNIFIQKRLKRTWKDGSSDEYLESWDSLECLTI